MNRTQEERVLFGTVPPESAYEDEAAAIDAQLMQLSLRYHGVSLPSDSGALENLRWLFQMAQWRSGQPQEGLGGCMHQPNHRSCFLQLLGGENDAFSKRLEPPKLLKGSAYLGGTAAIFGQSPFIESLARAAHPSRRRRPLLHFLLFRRCLGHSIRSRTTRPTSL